jgi:hypothetical protein
VAISTRSNRQKSDRDPAEWMPEYDPARCRYISEWGATKLRAGNPCDSNCRDQ